MVVDVGLMLVFKHDLCSREKIENTCLPGIYVQCICRITISPISTALLQLNIPHIYIYTQQQHLVEPFYTKMLIIIQVCTAVVELSFFFWAGSVCTSLASQDLPLEHRFLPLLTCGTVQLFFDFFPMRSFFPFFFRFSVVS